MRLRLILSFIVALVSTQLAVAAEVPQLQKLSEHVYAYVGTTNAAPARNSFGANVGVVIGRDSVLVIDTLISAKNGQRLLDEIRKLTDKPIRYVVNTHDHLDHAWGNCAFSQQGAVIIGHDNSRLDMLATPDALSRAAFYGLSAADLEGTTLVPPTVCLKTEMIIDLGDFTVELSYPGPSHTNGSITAYIPQDKVIFVGDILFTGYHPYLASGDLEGWQQAIKTLLQTPATQIVPGHGPVSTAKDLQDMLTYIQTFDRQAKALTAGKSAADAQAIADQLAKRLPDQNRTELPMMVKINLESRYLPSPSK